MLQDIINKNEIATDNSMKLIETSLTEIGVEASTQTSGLSLRELEGLDRELRMIRVPSDLQLLSQWLNM